MIIYMQIYIVSVIYIIAIKTIRSEFREGSFLPENNVPLKNIWPTLSWAQVEQLIDITRPFLRYRTRGFQNYNEVVTYCLPVAPENISTPSFTIKMPYCRAVVPVMHLQSNPLPQLMAI